MLISDDISSLHIRACVRVRYAIFTLKKKFIQIYLLEIFSYTRIVCRALNGEQWNEDSLTFILKK